MRPRTTPVPAPPGDLEPRSPWRWVNLPFLGALFLYRVTLAPFMGGHCRFHPSCSRFAIEAFRTRNPIAASWITIRRLARCHPWGSSGFDPVPDPTEVR